MGGHVTPAAFICTSPLRSGSVSLRARGRASYPVGRSQDARESGSADFPQPPGLRIEDEPADVLAGRQLAARAQSRETRTQRCLEVVERTEPPVRADPV